MAIPHLGITGKKGEDLAREYLEGIGLKFIEANARVPGGELDLVMHDSEKNEYVFVEVKTRTNTKFGEPIASITPNKQHILKRSILMYMQNFPWQTQYRLDLVAIMLTTGESKIEHLKYITLT
ncbi:MAG: YraN family protein [bacterium]|nr:YraN family protein [bacterium]